MVTQVSSILLILPGTSAAARRLSWLFSGNRLPVSTAYAYRQRKMQLRHRAVREMAQKYVVI